MFTFSVEASARASISDDLEESFVPVLEFDVIQTKLRRTACFNSGNLMQVLWN